MTRSLANVIFKRIWAKLVLLRQRALKMEENSRKQKEDNQDRKIAEMGLSATEQKKGNRLEKLDKAACQKG